ncbi:MAG TPA: carbonic anhydrase [Bacilli bacterium]|nr:carbonic anhydrase [Bacilli bacterium]
MSMLKSILEHNETFVAEKQYEQFHTTKFPDKKLVILTCMDTRLNELLPRAMNIKHGDAKIIRNAGAVISHPFGSIMRSIIIAVYELHAEEIYVVGHHGCGMAGLDSNNIITKAEEIGVSKELLHTLNFSGIDIKKWLTGFEKVEDNVAHSVEMIKNHPLLPPNIPVHGLVISPETGKLELVVSEYERKQL